MVLIGLTCGIAQEKTNGFEQYENYILRKYYIEAIQAIGANVVILPVQQEADSGSIMKRLDGLLFTGGGDLHSAYWQEMPDSQYGFVDNNRDRFELSLAKQALAFDVPVLGICRGMQVMNIALGGSLLQDISKHKEKGIFLNHQQLAPPDQVWHTIKVVHPKAVELLGSRDFWGNSFHHQAIDRLGDGLVCGGRAPDGIVELLFSSVQTFVWGVQWHPERLWRWHQPSRMVFEKFVAAAKQRVKTGNQ